MSKLKCLKVLTAEFSNNSPSAGAWLWSSSILFNSASILQYIHKKSLEKAKRKLWEASIDEREDCRSYSRRKHLSVLLFTCILVTAFGYTYTQICFLFNVSWFSIFKYKLYYFWAKQNSILKMSNKHVII